jgi:hypothetical protein
MRKVLIIDTSLLCVWLQVPGMEICSDATIQIVGTFYAQKGYQVEFLTADKQLKAQETAISPSTRTQKKRRSGR